MKHNEPAFPHNTENTNNPGAFFPAGGLTIREYFAARAPLEPQFWFMPTMPTPCPDNVWRSEDGSKYYPTQYLAEQAEGEDGYLDANAEVIRNWQREQRKQLLIQWPWAWADAVLEAGTK